MKHIRSIKDGCKFTLAVLYAGWLFATQRRPRTVIIYYHAVYPKDKRSFAKQINFLAKRYRIVKFSEIISSARTHNDYTVAITFDDAYENLLENAIPLLVEEGVPSAIFAPVGNLGEMPRWDISPECMDSQEKVMSEEQLVEADSALTEIHSHTMTHARLTEINPVELWDELANSRLELEKVLGHTVKAISYPHGSCNKAVFKMAEKAGYEYGFTIEPEAVTGSHDELALPRVSVSPKDSLFVFKLKLNGAYGYLKYTKRLKSLIQGVLSP